MATWALAVEPASGARQCGPRRTLLGVFCSSAPASAPASRERQHCALQLERLIWDFSDNQAFAEHSMSVIFMYLTCNIFTMHLYVFI